MVDYESTFCEGVYYIALLRGINVGGVTVKMDKLKILMETLNFKNVRTILATGNILFQKRDNPNGLSTATIQSIQQFLEESLSTTFKYTACVQVYTYESLHTALNVAASSPFFNTGTSDKFHSYLVFISERDVFHALKEEIDSHHPIEATKELERALFCDDENAPILLVYWSVLIGHTTSTTFAKLIAKPKYKCAITTRNIRTIEKLCALHCKLNCL